MPRCEKCDRLVPPAEIVSVEERVKTGETRHETFAPGSVGAIFGVGSGETSGTSEHFSIRQRRVCRRCAGHQHQPMGCVHLVACAIIGVVIVAVMWLIMSAAR